MRSVARRSRQEGSVIVTVCMLLLFLLGFMGLAMDYGKLFVVKTELQTAIDSCALAAAKELDAKSDALTRATSAGITAGNLNAVNFQSPTWSSQGQIVAGDITFKDAAYADTTVAASAKYAQCQHTQPAVQMWLMKALGAFTGDATRFPLTQSVAALAVATRASAQSTCPVPLALKPSTGTPPDYGFTKGQWITLLLAPGGGSGGQIGWANLDGSNSAAETEAELRGSCGTKVGDTLGTPGVQASIADVWNARFGIYRGSGGPSTLTPDFTGYSYTAKNWPSAQNAYDGSSGGTDPTAENFVTKRQEFASCDDTGTRVNGPNSCESITGLSLSGFSRLAVPGPTATGGHKQYGADRRLVIVPIINGASQVTDYACMLLLQPLTIPMTDVKLEYRGNAGAEDSPCTTAGLPGGSVGPLVPVLVR